MLRLGPDDAVVFQAAHSGETELAVLVDSIRRAAALSDVPAPHRPWLPALPATARGRRADVAGCRRDRRRAGRAAAGTAVLGTPADGNLALIGSRGAGTTTALRSLSPRCAADRPPSDVHVYVIDASGDERLDALADLPHCAGVVRPHERERLARLLRRLTGELDRRRAVQRSAPGHDRRRRRHARPCAARSTHPPTPPSTTPSCASSPRAPRAGIACVMTAERPGAVPILDPRRMRRPLAVPSRRPVRGDGVRRRSGARAGGDRRRASSSPRRGAKPSSPSSSR